MCVNPFRGFRGKLSNQTDECSVLRAKQRRASGSADGRSSCRSSMQVPVKDARIACTAACCMLAPWYERAYTLLCRCTWAPNGSVLFSPVRVRPVRSVDLVSTVPVRPTLERLKHERSKTWSTGKGDVLRGMAHSCKEQATGQGTAEPTVHVLIFQKRREKRE